MKKLIRKIIKEHLIKENNEQLKFTSIHVDLFGFYDNHSIDYETGSTGGHTHQTPKNKRIKIKITPVFDLSKAKENFIEEFELDNIITIDDFNEAILCQEGIFNYQNESDSDCDGTRHNSSIDFIPHKKIKKWAEIKEYVKSILKQSDIENAIRKIGEIKEFCKITDYTGMYRFSAYAILKKLQKENKIQWFENLNDDDSSYDGAIILKINNKFGLAYIRRYEKIYIIIPIVYDSFYKVKNKRNSILLKKGNKLYNWENNGRGKWNIVNVEDLS